MCHACTRRYINTEVCEKGRTRIQCLHEGCHAELSYACIEQALSMADDLATFARYDSLLLMRCLAAEPGFRWCSQRGCSNGQIVECKLFYKCHECQTTQWAWRRPGASWISETVVCPCCSNGVQKRWSFECDIIACRCGAHFCYRCGAALARASRWRPYKGHKDRCVLNTVSRMSAFRERFVERWLASLLLCCAFTLYHEVPLSIISDAVKLTALTCLVMSIECSLVVRVGCSNVMAFGMYCYLIAFEAQVVQLVSHLKTFLPVLKGRLDLAVIYVVFSWLAAHPLQYSLQWLRLSSELFLLQEPGHIPSGSLTS